MSVAAVMLVKDEADVIGYTLRHLLTQVDQVLVLDNRSTDGTYDLIHDLACEHPAEVFLGTDEEVAYYQSRKTSALARQALERGHSWVVPCDADEVWYSPHGRIGDVLDGLGDEYLFATADLYDHISTNEDPPYANPLERIGWRFRDHGALPKTAARCRPSLQIEMGNHGASVFAGQRVRSNGSPPTVRDQLVVRHFSWRSEDQYVRKIANGARAYAAAAKMDAFGGHWKAFGLPESLDFEERVRAHFRQWFYAPAPRERADLIYDPAPLGRRED